VGAWNVQSGATHVDASAERFRTRVRLPPPPLFRRDRWAHGRDGVVTASVAYRSTLPSWFLALTTVGLSARSKKGVGGGARLGDGAGRGGARAVSVCRSCTE